MLEFEDVVYLDVQKTGSTYIRRFLREFVKSSELDGGKHRPVDAREPGKVYVISCRDPLHQYKSLYAYGCKGLGSFRKRLDKAGKKALYDGTNDGFSAWLYLIASPTCRRYLSGFDRHPMLSMFGLQTLRFLRLALPNYAEMLDAAQSRDDILASLRQHGLMDVVIRQENLNEDLIELVTGPHRDLFNDAEGAKIYVETRRKLNTTEDVSLDLEALEKDVLLLVQQREWLFFDVLGYAPYV